MRAMLAIDKNKGQYRVWMFPDGFIHPFISRYKSTNTKLFYELYNQIKNSIFFDIDDTMINKLGEIIEWKI